ncbi:MAG: hypothetical protein IKA63_06425 [Clostridia bacterium]|nr:hypothetical protein [Clostridia bacterium]
MKKEKKVDPIDLPLELQSLNVQPTTAEELINKYGTYEIQPTSDSGNVFPTIAAGLPRPLEPKKKPDHE